MHNTVASSVSISDAENGEFNKAGRLLWVLPVFVLIPFAVYVVVGSSVGIVEFSLLAVSVLAAALVGRQVYQIFQSNCQELVSLRAQALDNCAQRDAAISALGNFFSEVLPIWARQIKMAQEHAREEVEVLAEHFDTIVNTLDEHCDNQNAQDFSIAADTVVEGQSVPALSKERRQDIRDSLDKILVSLQFQDRVNQILEAVGLNLEQIAAHIDQILDTDSEASLEELLSLTSWLELMQENYTMVEQKLVHRQDHVAVVPNADSNEVEFF